MAELSPAEKNKRRMKIHATNFALEDIGVINLRKIVRAGLALCERVELHEIPNVKAEDLYVTLNSDGLFTYEYHYTHEEVPLKNAYKQSALDCLARKYDIKV
ncbi:hypothetical protein KY333_01695 [Candidatus Woesearchaeota archaeon]|nr:hypothetical protein [Candidatus Woesearchaeota archaeon]MBW2994505.1 hypothetical protein [Candidatus Woesearchaeota archaeon]